MNKRIAIVAAGGFAKRIGTDCPKSLIKIDGTEILKLHLNDLSRLYLDKIIVYTNRSDYYDTYKTITSHFNNIELVIDPGFNSTFEIVHTYHEKSDSDILFTYGHTIIERQHYISLLQMPSIINCSLYIASSKTKVYKPVNSHFAEPPYFISKRFLQNIYTNNWEDFLKNNHLFCNYLNSTSPNEFNYKEEFESLKVYVGNLYKPAGNKSICKSRARQ